MFPHGGLRVDGRAISKPEPLGAETTRKVNVFHEGYQTLRSHVNDFAPGSFVTIAA